MNPLRVIVILLLIIAAPPAYADFQTGRRAANAGDYRTALHEWRPLAESGDARAQYNIGRLYANGDGVPQSFKTAFQWFSRSAGAGHVPAFVALGKMYSAGDGVPRDNTQALVWFRRAAERGDQEGRDLAAELEGKLKPAPTPPPPVVTGRRPTPVESSYDGSNVLEQLGDIVSAWFPQREPRRAPSPTEADRMGSEPLPTWSAPTRPGVAAPVNDNVHIPPPPSINAPDPLAARPSNLLAILAVICLLIYLLLFNRTVKKHPIVIFYNGWDFAFSAALAALLIQIAKQPDYWSMPIFLGVSSIAAITFNRSLIRGLLAVPMRVFALLLLPLFILGLFLRTDLLKLLYSLLVNGPKQADSSAGPQL